MSHKIKCPDCQLDFLLSDLQEGTIISDFTEKSYEENKGKFIEFEYFTFCPNCSFAYCNRSLTKTNCVDFKKSFDWESFTVSVPFDIISKLLKFRKIRNVYIESNNNILNIECEPIQLQIFDGDRGTPLYLKRVN